MIHVFTSSAPNYIGKVRILFESLRRHCPDMRTHWLVADQRDDELLPEIERSGADEVHFVDFLPGHYQDLSWLFRHDIVELSTAIKPAAAIELLNRGDCDRLVFFDPDQVIFSPLDDLVESLRQASVVLTPHLLEPEEGLKAVQDHELCALRNGIFNLGFFGVRDCGEGRAYLEWWRDRCFDFCRRDWQSGAFTDQKWNNFTPVFFPQSAILRSPRFNVAPWNINQRTLEGTFDEGFHVDGEPLGFYHFTGFDSGAHREVIDWYARGEKAVHGLVDWYENRTRFLTPKVDLSWRLGRYSNGQPVEPAHRKIYRECEDLQHAFPNPYMVDDDGAGFLAWLRSESPDQIAEAASATGSG